MTQPEDALTEDSRTTLGQGRLATLAEELRELRSALLQEGGPERIQRQHDQGKLTARERVGRLLDSGSTWVEVGFEEAITKGSEVNAIARRTEACREGVRRFLDH